MGKFTSSPKTTKLKIKDGTEKRKFFGEFTDEESTVSTYTFYKMFLTFKIIFLWASGNQRIVKNMLTINCYVYK